jgi:MrcB-like, N-terminal domain
MKVILERRWNECQRCLRARAPLAATVMMGGLLEALFVARANLMTEYSNALPISKIDLGSTARLPGDYAAGHALGVTYQLSTLPDEPKLRADLQIIVRAYRALTYRGGIDADVDSQSDIFRYALPHQIGAVL